MQAPLMVRGMTPGGTLSYLAACLGYLMSVVMCVCMYMCTCVCTIFTLGKIVMEVQTVLVIAPSFFVCVCSYCFSLLAQHLIILSFSALAFLCKVCSRGSALLHPKGN